MSPRVLVIVLCHNGVELTLACLESLRRVEYERADVLIVDNASTDGTPEAVRARFPEVTVVEAGANLGFAAGNNVGLRYALDHGYDYAMLLNNDTEVAPDFLQSLMAAAEADPAVGMAGPLIFYHDQPDILWSAGGAIDWRRGASRMLGLNEQNDQEDHTSREVDFVSGCALLVKRTALEQVGLIDERFYMYYEETEWCVRAARAGYRVIVVPQARIWHKISLEKRAASPTVHYYMTRNRLLFLRMTGANWRAFAHTLFLEYLRTLTSWSLRPQWRGMRAQRKVMLWAIADYFSGRVGRAPLRVASQVV